MPSRVMTVTAAEAGANLRDFLARRLELSRRGAKHLLDERAVFVDGRRIWMAHHALKTGDSVEIGRPAVRPEPGAPQLLYRDETLLAINKPAGCVVVGARGLEADLRVRLECPSLCAVHRLDRDTTGCLLFVIDPAVLPRLITMFRERTVVKVYDVLAFGRVNFAQRVMRAPLDGRSALTQVRCLRKTATVSHLEVRIATGRTHQIRRHLAAIGHPVVGDKRYGTACECPREWRDVARQMLHARCLQFEHPRRPVVVRVSAPLPQDFRACLSRDA